MRNPLEPCWVAAPLSLTSVCTCMTTCVCGVTFVVLVFKFCEIALMPLTNLYVLEFFFFPHVSYISQVVFCLIQSTFSKNLL